jgi:D-aspartate ligase
MKQNSCALILGGYVNGYSIIQELFETGVRNIILFDTSRKMASCSNKIEKFVLIDSSPGALLQELQILHNEYHLIVVFPTDDVQLENLYNIYEKISEFCFIPFNKKNLLESLDKFNQYKYCEILGIPYPKTIEIRTIEDIAKISEFPFPVLIKPRKQLDKKFNLFKNLPLQNEQDLKKNEELLNEYILKGISFIASEIIPGDGSNIYAYVGYRNNTGSILNEWTGKKLSQYPNDFGVFSGASNSAPEEVKQQGRILLHGMDLMGIAEPEFKYDHRDGKYKLMEINLRSMMWNRVGNLSGVKIQYTQYVDAIGGQVRAYNQEKTIDIHFVYLKHEIINLISRKGYYKNFLKNIFSGNEIYFAFFDIKDLKPFLFSCFSLLRELIIKKKV